MAYDALKIQEMLYRLIPVTRGLGIEVSRYGGGLLELSAPLEANHNHQNTAFGGSLYCVAIAAAWGILHLWFDARPMQGSIIVQDGAMDYLKPVTGDFVARCLLPDSSTMARLEKTLSRHDRARVAVSSTVYLGEEPVAEFRGRFVLLKEA
ncbi:YiiD C-terminal domain-containing protein [Mangrovitalea sediminis]|uniref:YiiD C-terminal domain-containing protein n=1 Tax=Mangrovitalea sediminis TaxID=1982043 RepID=UPI000BE5AD9A|nr:YiiD C-terminal domain-containing protein [Mangrovitalea sediminis]